MTDIFVFGSNREGRHGKGAALDALLKWSAKNGTAWGLQGRSYAIVTKELRPDFPPVTLEEIRVQVGEFLAFARSRPELRFLVTAIGCGLAGFTPKDIAPMFKDCPKNVILPKEFLSKQAAPIKDLI
jgi:hypothetical protein